MWDTLLVLGLVPGTNFQITFLEIVWTLYVSLTVWVLIKKSRAIHSFASGVVSNISYGIYMSIDGLDDLASSALDNLNFVVKKLRIRERTKNVRGITAGKLHARHRIA